MQRFYHRSESYEPHAGFSSLLVLHQADEPPEYLALKSRRAEFQDFHMIGGNRYFTLKRHTENLPCSRTQGSGSDLPVDLGESPERQVATAAHPKHADAGCSYAAGRGQSALLPLALQLQNVTPFRPACPRAGTPQARHASGQATNWLARPQLHPPVGRPQPQNTLRLLPTPNPLPSGNLL